MAEFTLPIKPKKSSTPGEVPAPSDLEISELAVNTADGKLFTKHTDGSVVTISGGGGAADLGDLGDVTANVPQPGTVNWLFNNEYADGTTSGVSNEGAIAYTDFSFNSCDISTDVAKFGSGSLDLRNGFAFFANANAFTAQEAESLAPGTGDFTVEQWVYWTTVPTGTLNVVSMYAQTTASSDNWYIFWNGASTSFDVKVGSTTHSTSSVSPSINTWHHVVMTRESGVVKFFFDGAEILSAVNTGNIPARTSFKLFLGGGGGIGQNLNGYMDGFRFVKGGALYAAAFTPPTEAPTATPTVAPADGQVLTWVDANSRWEPATPSTVASIDDLTDVDTSATPPTSGQVLTWVDANSRWEPADAASGGATDLGDLNDVVSPGTIDRTYNTTPESSTGGFNFGSGYFWVNTEDSNGLSTLVGDFPQGTSGTVWISTNGDPFLAVPYSNLSQVSSFLQFQYDSATYVFTKTAPCLLAFSDPTVGVPADGQVLTWVDANNRWEPTDAASGGAAALGELTDVDTTTSLPTNGQALVWDSGNSVWSPGTVSSGGGATVVDQLSDVNTSGLVVGDVLKWDGVNWVPKADLARTPYVALRQEVGTFYQLHGLNGFYADQAALEADGFTFIAGSANADDVALSFDPGANWTGKDFVLAGVSSANWQLGSNGCVTFNNSGPANYNGNGEFTTQVNVDLVVAWWGQDTETRLAGWKEHTDATGVTWLIVRADMKVPFNSETDGYPVEAWFSDDGRVRVIYGALIGTATPLTVGNTRNGIATLGKRLTAFSQLPTSGGSYGAEATPVLDGLVKIGELDDVDTTTTPPTDGQALVWDDASSDWKPGTVAAPVDSVNGETGAVSLGVQNMDDYAPNQALGEVSWAAYSPSGTSVVDDNQWWISEHSLVVSPTTTTGDQLSALQGVTGEVTLTDSSSASFTFTPSSVTSDNNGVSGGPRVLMWGVGAAISDAINKSGGLTLSNATFGALDVDLADGDCLRWNDAESKFKPTQLAAVATSGSYNDLTDQPALPGPAPVDSVNGQTGAVSLGVQDLSDYEAAKLPSTIIFPNKATNYTTISAAGEWSADTWGGTPGGFVVMWLSAANGGGELATQAELVGVGDSVTFSWPDGSTSTETVAELYTTGNKKGFAIHNPHTSNFVGHADGTSLQISSSEFTTSADQPLADGEVLQWNDTDQKFKPAQLPDVIDRIQDQTDFKPQQLPGSILANERGSNNWDVCGDKWVFDAYQAGNYIIGLGKDHPQLNEYKLLEAGDEVTFTWPDGSQTTSTVGDIYTVTSTTNECYLNCRWFWFVGDDPAGALLSGALTIESVKFTGAADMPLADGDILKWDDADQNFRPVQLPDVIDKATLKAEVAAATDFADFQARIAAL